MANTLTHVGDTNIYCFEQLKEVKTSIYCSPRSAFKSKCRKTTGAKGKNPGVSQESRLRLRGAAARGCAPGLQGGGASAAGRSQAAAAPRRWRLSPRSRGPQGSAPSAGAGALLPVPPPAGSAGGAGGCWPAAACPGPAFVTTGAPPASPHPRPLECLSLCPNGLP